MTLSIFDGLRADNWIKLSVDQRISTLQAAENYLAGQEHRTACTIGLIPKEQRESQDGIVVLRGFYNNGQIALDESLLQDELPYQAAETYFHEARHAYQHYAIDHPEIHLDQEQVADWERNRIGYIDPEKDGLPYSYYRWQPNEADANATAREKTENLYGNLLQDDSQEFQNYTAQKESELSGEVNLAQLELGDNYKEIARETMLIKYNHVVGQVYSDNVKNQSNTEDFENLPTATDKVIPSTIETDYGIDNTFSKIPRKGVQLNNAGEVTIEKSDGKTEIFRGSGALLPNDAEETKGVDGKSYKPHSHTVINEAGEVVYDRDEYGNVFVDTKRGDTPAEIPPATSAKTPQTSPQSEGHTVSSSSASQSIQDQENSVKPISQTAQSQSIASATASPSVQGQPLPNQVPEEKPSTSPSESEDEDYYYSYGQ